MLAEWFMMEEPKPKSECVIYRCWAARSEYVCKYDNLIVCGGGCHSVRFSWNVNHSLIQTAQHVHRFCSDRQLLYSAGFAVSSVCKETDMRQNLCICMVFGIHWSYEIYVETTMSRAQWHRPCVGWGFIIALLSHRHMKSNAIAQVIDVDYLLMLWRRVLKYVKTTMRHFILDLAHHKYTVCCIGTTMHFWSATLGIMRV